MQQLSYPDLLCTSSASQSSHLGGHLFYIRAYLLKKLHYTHNNKESLNRHGGSVANSNFIKFLRNFTDLGSLIGNTQCGYFRTFLPLRFYAKSILVNLKPPKVPFSPFEQLWMGIVDIFKSKFFPKIKIQSFKTVKMAVSDLLKPAKIDFT